LIAKKPARLGDIGEAMADVARTERAVDGFGHARPSSRDALDAG
jgi:hypothetical protein